jgi:hypothetical protein
MILRVVYGGLAALTGISFLAMWLSGEPANAGVWVLAILNCVRIATDQVLDR